LLIRNIFRFVFEPPDPAFNIKFGCKPLKQKTSEMNKLVSSIILASAGLFTFFTGSAGQDTLLIFNENNMDGWVETEFPGQGRVRVKEGSLILGNGDALTGVNYVNTDDLVWDNYEITLEAMRVEGSDFFCGLTIPVKESFCTLILGGWGGSVTGLSCIDGYDAANNFTGSSWNFENNKWYKVRIRVANDKIEAWLNRMDKIVDFTIGNYKLSLRSEVELSAPLGIATYRTTGALKNIRLIKF
jgi:hypothetical protein